jgi:histidyl-tRNA synthetase
VGLRFDLTIPLARFVAQHLADLGTPFKRYHIGCVWRGENTQRGRYREFMQCDFDTVGTKSEVADIETCLVVYDLMRSLGFDRFAIRINDRRVLSGLLERLGIAESSMPILRALDKLTKIGRDRVAGELIDVVGVPGSAADEILKLASLSGSPEEILRALRPIASDSRTGEEGISRLEAILAGLGSAGVPPGKVLVDPSIARGLDYYTGTVLETLLDDLPGIGSVCSGGRYDDLTGVYSQETLPGIGASLGLDRLLAAMEELGMIPRQTTPAPVLIVYFDPTRLSDYLALATAVRSAGIATELFPEPKILGVQLKYADRRGFRVALIAGPDELSDAKCQVKDLARGLSETVSIADGPAELIGAVGRVLGRCQG